MSRSLVWGGVSIAVTQLVPIFQVMCGAFGLGMWQNISGHSLGSLDDDGPSNTAPTLIDNLGVFTVVLLTAQPMWMAAVLIGAFFRWWAGDTPLWQSKPLNADPVADD